MNGQNCYYTCAKTAEKKVSSSFCRLSFVIAWVLMVCSVCDCGSVIGIRMLRKNAVNLFNTLCLS